VAEFSKSAINLDRAVLQRTDLDDWLEEVAYIQKNMTPEIVKKAFEEMPEEVQDEQWQKTQEDFLAREANLEGIITRYYEHFLKFQTLKGTDKDDIFIVDKSKKGQVSVLAQRFKKAKPADTLFQRTFYDGQTEDLWLYGLDDDDTFVVIGNENPEMRIVIAGGKGKDNYRIENGKGVRVFDYKSEENAYSDSNSATFIKRDDYNVNHYSTEKEPSVKSVIGFDNSYNPDYGYIPRLSYQKMIMDYETNPYSRMYGLGIEYHSLTQAAIFDFRAGLSNAFKHLNLELNGRLTTNNYTENFFGFGNGSSNNIDLSFDAARIALQRKNIGLSLYKNGDYGSSFRYGIEFEQVDVDGFSSDNYLNYHINYAYVSKDDERFTSRGTEFTATGGYTDDLDQSSGFFFLDPALAFWNAVDSKRKLVLKTAVAGQLRLGDDPLFYQAARIGANSGLRGYRMQRFTGNQSVVGTAELRYDFKPRKTGLFPLYITTYAGVDAGRVWSDLDINNNLYAAYGGGLELFMQGIFSAGVSYFQGEDHDRLEFAIRFSQ
jgi:hypothetical protein